MSPETLLGMELGKSVLQRLLGQGTMGAVYLASQGDRQVAIKVFLPAAALDQIEHEEFLKRLEDIISQNAALKHPHILATLDYGRQNGLVYQVMPFNAGENLEALLKRAGALPFAQIQLYLAQLASALDYAHTNGILHRDIKPSNILLTPDGNLLLGDFALAGLTTEKNFAKTRRAMSGMLNAIAPEYVLGKAVDPRADLYSLGAVLYQMVTGAALFQAGSLSEVAMKQVKATPASPRSLRADLPQAAEQVILRALAKRPSDRYSHARDLASAFRLALEATASIASQETNALTRLADLANNGSAAERIAAPRRGGLFDPKWQSQGSLPAVGSQPGPNFNATMPLAGASALSESAALGFQGNASAGSQQYFGSAGEQQGQRSQIQASTNLPQQFIPPTPFGNKAQHANLLTPTRNNLQTDILAPDLGLSQQQTASEDARHPTNQPASNTEEFTFAFPRPAPTPTDVLGALTSVPGSGGGDKSTTSALKFTDTARMMPDADQTGHLVTDFLPSNPVEEKVELTSKRSSKRGGKGKEKRGRKRRVISNLLVAALVLIAGLAIYLTARSHTGPVAPSKPQLTTAMRTNAQATASAHVILADDLSQNTHGWPVGQQGWYNCLFMDGTYHIVNNDKNRDASVIAPINKEKGFSGPFVYNLTMDQLQGDQTSPNNQFGMILDENIQTINGKQVVTFYAFEILNRAGGQYQFWKYDGTKSGNPWSEIWTKNFGKEFLQGSGPAHVNTVAVAANGTMFTFTVNGTQVGTLQDSSFASGDVGMLVNLDGAEVAFSHFLVTRV